MNAEGRHRPHGTTVLGVLRDGAVAIGADGQVTFGDVVLKHRARKLRTLAGGTVVAGFAGAVADALTLFARFESQLEAWEGNLRRLEAQLIVADKDSLLVLSGEGDVIEPDDGVVAIGAGAPFATAAAKALVRHTDMSAEEVVRVAMEITAEICIFTNDQLTLEVVGGSHDEAEDDAEK